MASIFISCAGNRNTNYSVNREIELDSGTWELFWSDEFDGRGKPDPAKWTHEIGIHPTEGSQYYTDAAENCYQRGGSLFIKALDKPMGGDPYTSARITTQNNFEFTYGRVEFRAKVPQDLGSWPALWLLGANYGSAGWPGCGEIDVMESVGFEGPKIHASAHALNYYWKVGSQQTGTIQVPDAAEAFHVYAVEWYPDHMDFFVDDTLYLTVIPKGGDINDPAAWPFNSDQFIIMNICVDGQWAQAPTPESFPMEMEVDYVRVYKLENSSGLPYAYAGEDISLGDQDNDGVESLILDASGSRDSDGTIENYSWKIDEEEIATGVNPELTLEVGIHTLQLTVTDNSGNTATDELVVSVNQRAPYKAMSLPGTIEVEDYDIGGQEWTYYDSSEGNSGNEYRSDLVDIGIHESGYNLGWIAMGEFVEYTLESVESGTYDIYGYIASDNSNSVKDFRILLNGDIIAELSAEYTQGWTNWQEISVENIEIKASDSNVLRIELLGDEFNIDKLIFDLQ